MFRYYTFQFDTAREFSFRRAVIRTFHDWRVSAYSLLIGSVLLILISSLAHGDDVSPTLGYDPKSITTAGSSGPVVPTGPYFLALPTWAHGSMPAVPWQLTPLGKKPASVAAIPPASLSPQKESTAPVTTPAPAPVVAKPTAPPEAPALIAVSPFLQWIKSNPKAADEARAQAAQPTQPTAQTPTGPVNGANTIVAGPNGATNSQDPYWLPPLIDSPTFGQGPVTGSAAIYSTPQR